MVECLLGRCGVVSDKDASAWADKVLREQVMIPSFEKHDAVMFQSTAPLLTLRS